MPFQFQGGQFVGVGWQAQGLGVATALNIKSHDLKLSVALFDVTGVLAGGVRARIGGPSDADGNVQCDMDLLAPPYANPPLIQPGVSGIALFGLSPVKSIQVPLIVETLHFASAIDKEVAWDFATKCNSLAGFIVFPAL